MANEFESVGLMDFLALDTTGVEAKQQGEILPRLFGSFECIKAEIEESKDKQTGKVKGFNAKSEWKLNGVINLLDRKDALGQEVDEAKLVGKSHHEFRFVNSPEGVQYLLGFLENCGLKERGQIGALWKKLEGRKITALVTHRANPNDADKKFSSLDKIKPVEA